MIFGKSALMLLAVFANTLFLLSFIFVQRGNVPFRNCKLLSFIPDLPVFGISLFLGCQKLSILCIQIFDFWNLLNAKLIKCCLRCFMKSQLFTMRFKELFAVSGLPVLFVSAPW